MTLAIFSWADRFESYLVETPEGRFSRDKSEITREILYKYMD